jgi:exopolyphosphatase/guanosine-5'-triphosphate,3'-diphosphate pyrophosphatase
MAATELTGVHHGNLPPTSMLYACVDIGTNTTRVLVAEAGEGGVREVMQQRAFTRIGRDLRADGAIPPDRVREIAAVVATQVDDARRHGARAVRVVATAAIRAARNRDDLLDAVRAACGVEARVLDGHEEARLAFLGATHTLPERPTGIVAVVDVGGGSTEIAVGTYAGGVDWTHSFPVGSGSLSDRHRHADPVSAAELDAMRDDADAALADPHPPAPDRALAVGGSAASLRRLVGPELGPEAMERALGVLVADPAAAVAARWEIDEERVRLLPAGILVLGAAARRLGRPLRIGCGGLREGVLLELAAEGA